MIIRKNISIVRRVSVLVGLLVIGVAAYALYQHYSRDEEPTVNNTPTASQQPVATSTDKAYGLPLSLQIPKIGVNTNIAYMGLTEGGEMDVPPDLVTVGWYKFGTKPGEKGSAVIAGHLEGTEDLGVFTDLDTLVVGDTISVKNDRNQTVNFAVRETKMYSQHDRPNEIFNKTDGSYLNLITCAGTWDNAAKRYSHRFVVFAAKTS